MFFKSRNCIQVQTLLGFLYLIHLSSKINCQINPNQGKRNETHKFLSHVLRNPKPPKPPNFCTGIECPSCPICFENCDPCVPAFFSYCSMCHQRCRCRGPPTYTSTTAATTFISKSVFFKNAMRLIAKVHSISEEINKYTKAAMLKRIETNSNKSTQANVIAQKNPEFAYLLPIASALSYTSLDNKTIKQHTDLVGTTPKLPQFSSPSQMRRQNVFSRLNFSDSFNSPTTEKRFSNISEETSDELYDEEASAEISHSSLNVTVTQEQNNTTSSKNVTGFSQLVTSSPVVSTYVPIASESVPMRDSRPNLTKQTLNLINPTAKLEKKNNLVRENDEPTKFSIEEAKDILEPTLQLYSFLNKNEVNGLKCRNVPSKDIQPIVMTTGLKRPVLWQPYIVLCSVPKKNGNESKNLLYAKKRVNYNDIRNKYLRKIKELKDFETNEILKDNNDRVRKLWKLKSELWSTKNQEIDVKPNKTTKKRITKRMIVPKKKTKFYILRKNNPLSGVTILKKDKLRLEMPKVSK